MIKNTRKLKNPTVKTTSIKPEPPKAVPAQLSLAKTSRVSLELVQPGAKNVFVAGSFNGWKPENGPLVPVGDGHWVGNLTVDPGRYEYLFVVDGQWLPDPNAKETVVNPYGGRNSVLTVSE